MSAPDWSVLSPAHRTRWERLQDNLDHEERKQTIADLRFMREMRRNIERDALLNDRKPQGLEEIDATIERLIERLL